MEYKKMGGSGLVVSALSFGFWATFGVKDNCGVPEAEKIMTVARKAGVNLFDNAEAYGQPNGRAEEIMGEALQNLMNGPEKDLWKREDLILTTKIFWSGGGINAKGVSMKHVKEGLTNSLRRLRLEYVDIVFAHRYDYLTPTEEIVRAFTQQIRDGKALYWGTSEWTSQQITEAYWIARQYNLIPPVVEQPQYNLCERKKMEVEYAPIFKAPYSIGTTIWSPLKSGILTGKYNKDIPKGSRMDQKGYEWLAKQFGKQKADLVPKVDKLMAYAKANFNCSVTQLSIAWCVKNPNVSTVLLGSTKTSQLEENLAALKVARMLTREHMNAIDEIMGSKPDQPAAWGRSLQSTF